MQSKQNTHTEQPVGCLMELSKDERTYLLEEAIEKERRDNASRIKAAFAEGKQTGKAEGQLEDAKRLLFSGLTPDQVSEYIDIPLADIENSLNNRSNQCNF
jgi:flagellar biosynthesis/type III secretory pathway protein FliH